MSEVAQLDKELKSAVVAFGGATDEVKKLAETFQSESRNLGAVTNETKAMADKAIIGMNQANERLAAMQAQVDALEQKATRRSGPAPEEHKSVGQRVVESQELKGFLDSGKTSVRISLNDASFESKAVLSATATWGATTSIGTSLVSPQRGGFLDPLVEQLSVRDLIAPGRTNSNAIEYPREATATNAAAVIAENTLKPLSDLTFDLESAPVRTIATRLKASRNILDDAPQLQTYIDGRLRYFVRRAEDEELLNGDGTGQHLLGIRTQATAYAAPTGFTATTALDTLRAAILQSTLALIPASGIVLHPTNWAVLEATKDAAGQYLIGDPQGGTAARIWNMPVALTLRLPVNTFLTGAFREGAQIFDRLGIEVLVSTEDEDNFSRNMVTIRAEERLALAVYRPEAFITGTLA
jgi:HK97 family phage major capsid protein